jgi:hypothetical protein
MLLLLCLLMQCTVIAMVVDGELRQAANVGTDALKWLGCDMSTATLDVAMVTDASGLVWGHALTLQWSVR